MMTADRVQVFTEIKDTILKLHDMWEYNDDITPGTYFFADLGFESIDIVVLAARLEERFQQPFPFTEFLVQLGDQDSTDISLRQVVEFITENLRLTGSSHANSND